MRTVHDVSKLTGVSIRTLHYYDKIGLLHPAQVTEAKYRLYDDTDLERLQLILLYRELQFPLKEIKSILNSSDFDRNRALEQQINLLKMRKEHLENLINLACEIKKTGVRQLDFTAFDTSKINEYAAQAKATYGHTAAYNEFEKKSKNRTVKEEQEIASKLMSLFKEFGEMTSLDISSQPVQMQVNKLQDFITKHYYACTNEILKELGAIYSSGGEMTENIDKAGGKGTTDFASKAIAYYCKS